MTVLFKEISPRLLMRILLFSFLPMKALFAIRPIITEFNNPDTTDCKTTMNQLPNMLYLQGEDRGQKVCTQ